MLVPSFDPFAFETRRGVLSEILIKFIVQSSISLIDCYFSHLVKKENRCLKINE